MRAGRLEHLNLTVSDPDRTAVMLINLFGWRVRWRGEAIHGGESIHIGGDDTYLAVYRLDADAQPAADSYRHIGSLNHVGVVVDDLDAAEARVKAFGFEPFSHADYHPGRRFYFRDADDIEFEVVSYS